MTIVKINMDLTITNLSFLCIHELMIDKRSINFPITETIATRLFLLVIVELKKTRAVPGVKTLEHDLKPLAHTLG